MVRKKGTYRLEWTGRAKGHQRFRSLKLHTVATALHLGRWVRAFSTSLTLLQRFTCFFQSCVLIKPAGVELGNANIIFIISLSIILEGRVATISKGSKTVQCDRSPVPPTCSSPTHHFNTYKSTVRVLLTPYLPTYLPISITDQFLCTTAPHYLPTYLPYQVIHPSIHLRLPSFVLSLSLSYPLLRFFPFLLMTSTRPSTSYPILLFPFWL